MIKLTNLLNYLPTAHGEHGVDAFLHGLAKEQGSLHEVFSNPPGGSWTQFDILQPNSGLVFRWDHMPRVSTAKRPDFVVQKNLDGVINLLSVESKRYITQVEREIAKRLTQYFTARSGIKNKPAWHFKKIGDSEWKIIPPDKDSKQSYWFRDYDDKKINFWSGFAYGLSPEHYGNIKEFSVKNELAQQASLIKREGLNFVIGIGWQGKYHMPFAVWSMSGVFSENPLGTLLSKALEPFSVV